MVLFVKVCILDLFVIDGYDCKLFPCLFMVNIICNLALLKLQRKLPPNKRVEVSVSLLAISAFHGHRRGMLPSCHSSDNSLKVPRLIEVAAIVQSVCLYYT